MLGSPLSKSQCLRRALLHSLTLLGSATGEQGTMLVSLLYLPCIHLERRSLMALSNSRYFLPRIPHLQTEAIYEFGYLGFQKRTCGTTSKPRPTSPLAVKLNSSQVTLNSYNSEGQDPWLASSLSLSCTEMSMGGFGSGL